MREEQIKIYNEFQEQDIFFTTMKGVTNGKK